VGQSQGARAALAASLLAPQYAPAFSFKGTVATGVPGAPPNTPETKAPQIAVPPRTGGGANARVALLSVFMYLSLDPAFNPAEYLSDAAKPALQVARTGCNAAIDEVVNQNRVTVENMFKKNPGAAAAAAARLQQYPAPKFTLPVFIGTGLADVTAFPEGQYNFAMAACSEGSTVEATII